MATVSAPLPSGKPLSTDAITMSHAYLSRELRRLTRAATFVAVLTSPTVYWWLHYHYHWSVGKSLFVTLALIIVFRGVLEILVRRVGRNRN